MSIHMEGKVRKAILIMSAVCLIILAAAVINYRITKHVVEKTIVAEQEDITSKAASTVEIWLKQQMKILEATAGSVSVTSLADDFNTMQVLQMAMRAGHFSDVYIGTTEGVLIDGAEWVPSKGYDPRIRPWFQRAVAAGGISFTTPYIDLVTNELVIALVTPLLNGDDFVGVMGADTVLDSLVENVLNFKQSETGYAFVVERSGTIIIHPDKNLVMREMLQDIDPELAGSIKAFRNSPQGTIFYRGKNNLDNVLSYREIADSGWFLCVTVPHDEAYSMIRKTTMIFAMEIVLRVLVILAFVVLLALAGGSMILFFFSKRYSSAVQQHQEELSGMSRDLEWNITRRKEVETYYKTLFNVANDAILISSGYDFVECNHKAEEVFGLSREAIISKSIMDVSPDYQADGTPSMERLAQVVDECFSGAQIFRWSFKRADGTEFPASVGISMFQLDEKTLTLLSVRDISKRVDAEGQLMQAQKMAAAGEMLGAIAHQWRQPLNTLSTYISSLEAAHYSGSLSKDVVEKIVAGAGDQIRFMSKTIDDFRNFFKPSKTKGPFDVFTAVISAVKLMEAQMRHGDIRLTVKNNTPSSSLVVFGYQGEFIHVLVNILANAKDAITEQKKGRPGMGPQLIEIAICSDGDTAVIQITDSGCGIPEHLLAKIFNPYYTTKGTSSGTGMGLYMSKMIVEKEMGGTITAENTGNGARFTIVLKRLPGIPPAGPTGQDRAGESANQDHKLAQ